MNETNSFMVQTQKKFNEDFPARLSSDDDEYLADVLPSIEPTQKNMNKSNSFMVQTQKKFEFKIHQPDFIFDHNILLWSFSCCGERWFEFHWKSMEAACWSIHSYECEWSVSYRMFIRMLTQFRLVVVCMNIKDKNGNTVTGSRAVATCMKDHTRASHLSCASSWKSSAPFAFFEMHFHK